MGVGDAGAVGAPQCHLWALHVVSYMYFFTYIPVCMHMDCAFAHACTCWDELIPTSLWSKDQSSSLMLAGPECMGLPMRPPTSARLLASAALCDNFIVCILKALTEEPHFYLGGGDMFCGVSLWRSTSISFLSRFCLHSFSESCLNLFNTYCNTKLSCMREIKMATFAIDLWRD